MLLVLRTSGSAVTAKPAIVIHAPGIQFHQRGDLFRVGLSYGRSALWSLRSACASVGHSTAQKIAFLFGSGKSFFPSGNGDAALRGAASGFGAGGAIRNSSFSTRARRYPALRIWRSISGKASFRKSCPSRCPGFAHSNCGARTRRRCRGASSAPAVPAATAWPFGVRKGGPAHRPTR